MSEENESEKSVPFARFEKKVNENNALKTSLRDMQAELDEVKKGAEGMDETNRQLAELKAQAGAERQTHKTTLALYKAGITDDETAELVRWRFAKSEKSADEFEAWLANDAPEDRLLASHFSKPEAVPEASNAPTVPAPVPQPSVNNGTRAAPPPRAPYTVESVQGMSTDQLRENYASIMDAWGFGGKAS